MFDIGLFLIRAVVGALLAGHGLQKLIGWFGGPGVEGNAEFLRSLGYRPPRPLSRLHGLAETGAGILLIAGLLTPAAAAAVIAVMVQAAVAVHARNGLWVQDGGYEYPLVLAATAAGIALTGPGAWSLDAWLGWDLTGAWALAGIAAGLAIGVLGLATRSEPGPAGAPTGGRRESHARAA